MEVCVRFGVILVGPVLRWAAGVLGVSGFNQVAAAVEEELGPRAVSSEPPEPAGMREEERPSSFRGQVVEQPVVGADLRGDQVREVVEGWRELAERDHDDTTRPATTPEL